MRVYIKTSKIGFIIPVPNALLTFGISIMKSPFIQKYIPEKDRKYVTTIDFKKLSGCVDILREYKGLRIVDVQSKDGTHVTITL